MAVSSLFCVCSSAACSVLSSYDHCLAIVSHGMFSTHAITCTR